MPPNEMEMLSNRAIFTREVLMGDKPCSQEEAYPMSFEQILQFVGKLFLKATLTKLKDYFQLLYEIFNAKTGVVRGVKPHNLRSLEN